MNHRLPHLFYTFWLVFYFPTTPLKRLKAKLDGTEMALEEARLDFIRAENVEIRKRATDRFEKLKSDHESRMAQLVYQSLCDILEQRWWPEDIAKLIDSEAKKKALDN